MKHLQSCLSLISRLPRWLEILLTAVLIWQCAGLFWLAFGPGQKTGGLSMPVDAPTEHPFIPTGLIKWFEASQDAAAPVSDIRLIALMSGPDGVALFGGLPSGDVAVKVGEEIRPGTRLLSVAERSVEINQDGTVKTLELPGGKPDIDAVLVPYQEGAASAAEAPPAQPAPPTAVVPPPPPANKVHEPQAVTRGQLGGAVQMGNIGSWNKGISTYRDGGILVEDAEAQLLAKTLKLKNGDVMKSVNGRSIKQLADISLVYNFFSQQSDVELVVLRDGSPQTLRYQIQP